jgi:hypothetical protein
VNGIQVKNSAWSISLIAMLLMAISSCSVMMDNATIMAYDLKSAAKKLEDQPIGSELMLTYKPEDAEAPFTMLILSENGVTYDELIERGLDSLIVEDLFPQLSHIDLKERATLIVYQNGTISYTTHYRRFVDVKTTQIISGKGNTEITVKTIGVGKGNVTDEVLLVELQ